MAKAQSVVDTILGEAGGKTRAERYEDMKGVASAIVNRAIKEGVSIEAVISGRGQFDAYGKGLPKGSEEYRDLAQQALDDVLRNGPTHKATFFATPSRVGNLPSGLKAETETAGHQYFSDPRDRAITVNREIGGTPPSIGTATAEVGSGLLTSYAPTKSTGSSPFDALFGGYEATPQTFQSTTTPSFDTGLLGVEREGYGSPFGALGDRITSDYGPRSRPSTGLGRLGSASHQGVDLSLGPGATGYSAEAVGPGVVSDISRSGGLGNTVSVTHPDGMTSRYSHLSEIGNVSVGDQIARGTPIGSVGNTGNSQASHLHFSMLDPNRNPVDPASIIDFNPNPTVPTPTFADRVTPGQQISDIANQSIQPSQGLLADPAVEMASLQERANAQRAAISANSGIPGGSGFDTGRFVTGDPNTAIQSKEALRTAMMPSFDTARFATDPASGLLAQPSFDPNRFAPAEDAATTFSKVGMLTQPALPGNIQHSVGLTGVQPTSTLSTSYQPTTAELPNISAPIDMAEEFSRTVPNPGQLRADQYGMQPTSVQTTTPDMSLTPPADITGPATSEIAGAQETQRNQTQSTPSRMGFNARNTASAVAGGLLGGAALGPIGGLLGAVLGHQAASGKGLFGGDNGGGLFSNPNEGLTTNDLGRGAAAAYGAWGGAPGTTGIATDGSRISAMAGGIVSRTDPNGITSRFGPGDTGPVYGGPGLGGLFGGWGGDDTDQDTETGSIW